MSKRYKEAINIMEKLKEEYLQMELDDLVSAAEGQPACGVEKSVEERCKGNMI